MKTLRNKKFILNMIVFFKSGQSFNTLHVKIKVPGYKVIFV